MKGFLSCNHPVKVNTLKGVRLVACGHCIQCKTAKRRKTELLLSLETQQNRYCELINLTYSDDFIPWVDLSAIDGRYNSISAEFDWFMRMVKPIHFGPRTKRMYNPKTKTYYLILDKDFTKPRYTEKFGLLERYVRFDTFRHSQLVIDLQNYNKRINAYYNRYPWRQRGESRKENHVAILWPEDLQKFIDRLKKWCLRKFGAKVRYFAVGEYGTNSLRPHWHIVLFHNCLQLRHAFEDVYRYPNSTKQNPRECAVSLFNDALWTYGDITTTPTDGHASSYLSGYLNQSASLPQLLSSFPQKTFKSIYLGERRSLQQVASLLKNRDYTGLTTAILQDRRGLQKYVPVPSSSYNRFHIGYTFDGVQALGEKYTLLRSAIWFINQQKEKINWYDDKEVYDVLIGFNSFYDSCTYVDKNILRPLQHYIHVYCLPVLRERNSVNPLKSLAYAAKKLYKMSNSLAMSEWTYLKLVDDFERWYDYQNLVNHLQMLEDNPTLAYQYYSTFDDALGIPDYNKYSKMSYFLHQQTLANMDWYASIKHKDVVMTYKTDL